MEQSDSTNLAVMSSQLMGVQKELGDFKAESRNSLLEIKGLINSLNYVATGEYKIEQSEQNRRINDLESFKDWAVKLILGQIIIAVVGVVMYGVYYK